MNKNNLIIYTVKIAIQDHSLVLINRNKKKILQQVGKNIIFLLYIIIIQNLKYRKITIKKFRKKNINIR